MRTLPALAEPTDALPDKSRLVDVRDDTLLSRSAETDAWNYLLDYLRRTSNASLERLSEGNASFFELDHQAAAYRGRVVAITGRVLRCEFRPFAQSVKEPLNESPQEPPTPDNRGAESESTPPDSADSAARKLASKPDGFYLCYVRMSDNSEIPLTLCVLDIPEGFPVEQKMSETISATGVFYKNRYLPIEADAYSSPTIIVKTLRWTPDPKSRNAGDAVALSPQQRFYRDYGAWVALAIVLILWFFIRRHFRKIDRQRREKRSQLGFPLSGQKGSCKPAFYAGMLTFALLLGGTPFGLTTIVPAPLFADNSTAVDAASKSGDASPRIDAALTRTMMGLDLQQWELLDEKIDPLESFRSSLLDLANRLLGTIPRYVLERSAERGLLGSAERSTERSTERSSTRSPGQAIPTRSLLDDPARFRGRVFRFRQANVVFVEEFLLSPSERETYRVDASAGSDAYRFKKLYRCCVAFPDGGQGVIFTPNIPDAWPRDRPFSQPCGATGIYLQCITPPKVDKESTAAGTQPVAPSGGGADLESLFDAPDVAIALLTPRLEWYPDDPGDPFTRLADGGNGVDAGTWDAIPNIALSDLTNTGTPGRPRLDKATIRKALWLTDADREPFYQTLGFIRRNKPGTLDRWTRERLAREERSCDPVFDLFRHPETQRAHLVRLHGVAKRIIPTLIEDRDIAARFGITRYYQIYLFTGDSQGNPIVICTPSLPKGMPSGTDADFAETITVSGFFYKLWAYEAAAPEMSGEEKSQSARRGQDETDDESTASGPRTMPRYAPLLLGGDIHWEPQEKARTRPDGWERYGGTGIVLVLLLLIWFYFRFARRPPPKTAFRIGEQSDTPEKSSRIRFR